MLYNVVNIIHTCTYIYTHIYSSINMNNQNSKLVYSPQGKIEGLESERPLVRTISMKDV